MSSKVLYLKAEQNAEVMQAQVCVKDIASVYCSDRSVTSKVKALKIYQFQEEKRKRQVISVLRVIELIEKECPAQNHGADGQADFCHADQLLRNRLYHYGISQ